MYTILNKKQLNPDTVQLDILAPKIAEKALPGLEVGFDQSVNRLATLTAGRSADLAAQLRQGYAIARDRLAGAFAGSSAAVPPAEPDGLVVCGMGGSAIGADLVLASLPPLAVPSAVVRGYELPEWAGPDTLVVVISYSGQTEEALRRGAERRWRGIRIEALSGRALQRAHDSVRDIQLLETGDLLLSEADTERACRIVSPADGTTLGTGTCCALARRRLDDDAAVVAVARVALGVLVRENRADRCAHRRCGRRLGCEHLQAPSATRRFAFQEGRDLRVGGQRIGCRGIRRCRIGRGGIRRCGIGRCGIRR